MTWMEGTFQGGAKNLTRIILRVADPLVDRIQVILQFIIDIKSQGGIEVFVTALKRDNGAGDGKNLSKNVWHHLRTTP